MHVQISKLNENFLLVRSDSESLDRSLYDHFTVLSEQAGWRQKKRRKEQAQTGQAKTWDGKIRLLTKAGRLPYGLLGRLQAYLDDAGVAYTKNFETPSRAADFASIRQFLEDETNRIRDLLDFEPYDYQKKLVANAILRTRSLNLSATSCHAKGDRIIMADGSIRNIEDILEDDLVMGPDGHPKKVIRLFRGKDRIYEVNPKSNRAPIYVTGEHVLVLGFTNTGRPNSPVNDIEYVTVDDYLNKHRTYKHISKLVYNRDALDFGPTSPAPTCLLPYFIGVYLGDGHSYSPAVTKPDTAIRDICMEQAGLLGLRIRTDPRNITYFFTDDSAQNVNRLSIELKKCDFITGNRPNRTTSENRHLPEWIFTQATDYRMEILAGLLDTDGHLNSSHTYFEFASKSRSLAEGVYRIATSLGFPCSTKTKIVNKTKYYYTLVMGDISRIPTRIPRKQPNRISSRDPYKTGFVVNEVGVQDYFGIQVEDELYLHESGMILHNSGKSLSTFLLAKFRLQEQDSKTLIIVPRITLVEQLAQDFSDYSGGDMDDQVHMIYGGHDKETNRKIVISTWQSLQDQPRNWFQQFDTLIVDEVHGATASEMKKLIHKCDHIAYRWGLTGTLDGSDHMQDVLVGYFGDIFEAVTTRQMIDRGIASPANVHVLIMDHPDKETTRKTVRAEKDHIKRYRIENDIIESNAFRNAFVARLAMSKQAKGENTLILFKSIDHGKLLQGLIPDSDLIYGAIGIKERLVIKARMKETGGIVLNASYGTFSTGESIPRIHNIIAAGNYKGRIKVLQSIGRGLRLHETKELVRIFDVADDLFDDCTSMAHLKERLMMYREPGIDFPYTIQKVTVPGLA